MWHTHLMAFLGAFKMVLWIEEHGMYIHMLCICVFPAALECHGPWPLGETWRLGGREGDSTSSRLPDPDAGTAAKDVSTGSMSHPRGQPGRRVTLAQVPSQWTPGEGVYR